MPYVADASGRGPSTAILARRGLVVVLLAAVVVAGLLARYRGAFQPVFPATAMVDDIGDGVRAGADVKLRGALVGSVGEVRVRPGAGVDGVPAHEVTLRLRPEMAREIPAGVTARVVPTNVFGAPSVELLDPPAGQSPAGGPTLSRGAVIPGDRSAETLQLQTVLNQLDKVLRAVEPATLNVALTNISQALQGRGERIGSIIGRLDRYLTTLNGHTDDFTADLALLGTDLQALADTAPALLDTVDNVVVTTRTVVDQRDELAATLLAGTGVADRVDGFLGAAGDRFVRVADDGRGLARTLAEDSREIPRSLNSLGQGTRALGEGLDQVDGGLAILFTMRAFTPYTARDCPRYPGVAGPNCKDEVPPPGAPPPSFPFYQGPPAPPPPFSRERSREDADRAPSGVPDLLGGMLGGGR